MEIIILILIILILIITVILFTIIKKNNYQRTLEGQNIIELKKEIQKTMDIVNKNNIYKTMEINNNVKNTTDSIDKKISNQNKIQLDFLTGAMNTLENSLNKSNIMTEQHIKEIITKVTQLDNIKEQINILNENVYSLEKVLNDKKARGTFGELRLSQILEAIFGLNAKKIYEEQYLLPNSKRVDFILHAPYPIGDLCIDSKFPLENYLNIMKAENESDLKIAQRNFKVDLKKHINTIQEKYIIPGVTSSQAIMFIPSETIFAHIYSEHEDIVNYSYQKKIWMASPTTIMSILNLVQIVLKDIKQQANYEEFIKELQKLKAEFERFQTRWDNLDKHMETINKDRKDLSITTEKILKKFKSIEEVNVKKS